MRIMRTYGANHSRRIFLRRAAGMVGVAAAVMVVPGRALGLDGAIAPNEKIQLGAIGIQHRGSYVLEFFLSQPDVRFRAIADVQRAQQLRIRDRVDQLYGSSETETYQDFRELLQRDDIDAVLIATGDRWHATASAFAARAGKDVYSEKPCALTIEQCGQLAETMRRTGRIFQGGTQRRSVENFRAAVRLARSGRLGAIKTVHASIYYLSQRTDWYPEQPLPAKSELDWDLWLGPAPWRPYNPAYVGSATQFADWRGHYDFDSGARHLDWGAHTVDLCQWAVGEDGNTPVRYWAEGDRMYADYASGVRLVMRPDGWMGLGTCPVRFEGEEGWVEAGDSGRIVVSSPALRKEIYGLNAIEGTDPAHHVRNFLDCVKSRVQPVCNADVIRSSHVACHASALSWILGRELTFDPQTETFNDDEANRLRCRTPRGPWTI